MKLESGLYKISDRRKPFPIMHLLKVFVKDGKKFYQIDNEIPQAVDRYGVMYLDGFQMIRKLHRPLEIKKARITITWYDQEDDRYETVMTNVQVLRRLFQEFPEIAGACGVFLKPSRQRE